MTRRTRKGRREDSGGDPWWHAAGLLSGCAFMVLLLIAREYHGLFGVLDRAGALLVLPLQGQLLTVGVFLAITDLGNGVTIAVMAVALSYLAHLSRAEVIRLAALLGGVGLSIDLAKIFVARMRPPVLLWVDPLHSYSFPSGHAALSLALYGFFAIVWARTLRPGPGRAFLVSLFLALPLAIGLSRLVLNVHYASDVVGGYLLALFWLSLVFMLPHTRWRYPQDPEKLPLL